MGQRVFVLRDMPIMQTPEQELKTIIDCLKYEGLEPEIVGDSVSPLDFSNISFDDLLIDYGGMAMMGAWDTAVSNLRYALKWIEDHPSVVVLVWTLYTTELVREVYDTFSDAPANVFIVSVASKDQEKLWRSIRAILGVKEPA